MNCNTCNLLWLLVSYFFSIGFSAGPVTKYRVKEQVPVSVNTIGPYRNPNERYPFFMKVPFCKPHHFSGGKSKQISKKGLDEGAGSVFAGDRPKISDYKLLFQEDMHEPQTVCEMTLTESDVKKYMEAIRENYMFEFFVDHELLVTGFLGKEEWYYTQSEHIHNDNERHHENAAYYLFTHWNFHCEYNKNYVISCRITTDLDKKVELLLGRDVDVKFTYQVDWTETDVPVNDRLIYHVRRLIASQPLEVHWLSTLNSFILVVLVTAFVAIVFATILRKDCTKYNQLVDDIDDVSDPGWKQLQRDVFRSPNEIMFFSAFIGTGTQLLVLALFVLLLSLVGFFLPGNRGALILATIFCYCFTAGVSGHISGTLYKQLGGTKWATNAVLTACLFPIPFFIIFFIINSIAASYGSSMALPFLNILYILLLWFIVTFPLTIYASHRVKDIESKLDVPTKQVSKLPRELPLLPWYRSFYVQICLSGILPFTAIYIELHFLFMAIFGHSVYTLFGILSLSFIMLLIVTVAVTIGLTYFQLQSEDWRWWWRSFISAGATGIYIFGYALFYYRYRSYMSGVLQGSFFFGYMLIVSYGFFLMLGAVGWWGTFWFLKKIYGAIKSE